MAKSVFFSFHYARDAWRVQQVVKMGALEGQPILNPQKWEEVKRRGDQAIKTWIAEQMKYKSAVVVLVGGRIHVGVIRALEYAISMRPTHLTAIHVADDEEQYEQLQRDWERFRFDVPLEAVHSPYRDLVAPMLSFLDELDARWDDDTITVLIPEFVVETWYENALHNQTALALKLALLRREGTVVTSVPYHV